jgi:magnesium transporter
MIERFHNGKLTWLNLKHPTEHDVEEVTREQKLPAHVMGDLLAPVPRNYALTYEGIIKVAIDFPVVKRIHAHHPYEVKFIITKHALITVQYEEMEGLDRFKKQFEVLTTLGKTSKKMSGPHLFFILMNELYNTSSSKLDYVESGIADIETEIFNDNERQMVLEIAKTNKRLIAFRHILRAHEDMFFELEPAMLVLYKDEHRVDIANLRKTFMLLSHRTNALFEILSSVRDANDAVLTAKQNETIKTLTIMAFITFPLTLFSSMFGMNTERTPIIGHAYDFWIIVGIMICVTASFFTFFKYKKWM